jgi:hypothetical protein
MPEARPPAGQSDAASVGRIGANRIIRRVHDAPIAHEGELEGFAARANNAIL